jgi:alpha-beta hydrolase superfamily lysophospholipase
MPFIEETIATQDGLRLYVRRCETAQPLAEVLIVHGFGEHSGRYTPLTDHLIRRHYNVTSYDHRGHGLSDGLPGHVDQFTDYEDDLDRVVAALHTRASNRRVVLIGHSMGGLIALRYLAREKRSVELAVISAPLIAVAVQIPVHKIMIAKVGTRVAPRLRLGNEIDPAVLSRDPQVGIAYAADPLVNRVVSPRWFMEAAHAMEEIKQSALRISVPILVMHGTEDRLASVEATEKLFGEIGSKDKELRIYPGYYHELFNEPEKQEIFEYVTGWLDQRVDGGLRLER